MDEKYFLVTVIVKQTDSDGKIKKTPEKYLCKDISYAGVEEKIAKDFDGTTFEYEIKSINDSKVIKVIE